MQFFDTIFGSMQTAKFIGLGKPLQFEGVTVMVQDNVTKCEAGDMSAVRAIKYNANPVGKCHSAGKFYLRFDCDEKIGYVHYAEDCTDEGIVAYKLNECRFPTMLCCPDYDQSVLSKTTGISVEISTTDYIQEGQNSGNCATMKITDNLIATYDCQKRSVSDAIVCFDPNTELDKCQLLESKPYSTKEIVREDGKFVRYLDAIPYDLRVNDVALVFYGNKEKTQVLDIEYIFNATEIANPSMCFVNKVSNEPHKMKCEDNKLFEYVYKTTDCIGDYIKREVSTGGNPYFAYVCGPYKF